MTRAELARLLDHSVLKPEATERDIREGADIVRTWRIGFYCVQPCWVKLATDALAGTDACVVSVVGFPHGCDRPEVKAQAALLAVADGAGEIDMVINLGALRSGDDARVGADVELILEATALTDGEKQRACKIAVAAGARFVKTSTGFHPSGGATVADVRLLRAAVGQTLGVKASGGIRTLAHARAMLDAGANRLGTSASATILNALDPD